MQPSSTQVVESARARMTLSAVTRGKIAQPMRVTMYGPPGIGKSTFAANAPEPIFIGAEKGTAELDVARFPQPESWADVLEAVRTLYQESHDFQTLVLDTLDWLEPLNHQAVVQDAGSSKIETIEDFGFGKGYVLALEKWRMLLSRLDRLCDTRGMNLILLAHSHIKTFKDPTSEHYDRYEMKLHQKSAGLIQEWADEVLFVNYETFTTTDKATKRTRGVSSGARLIHTVRNACWDAKNRHSLPDTLPLGWDEYALAVGAGEPASAAALREAIDELVAQADEELAAKVRATVAKAKTPAMLAQVLDRLKARMGAQ